MSEWVDFAVYGILIVLVFVLLPRHGRGFARLMIEDRNPEWLGRNRDVVARLERSRWFLNACYAWAAASLSLLLGVMLDLIDSPFGVAAPKWEVLKDLNGMVVIVGTLGWGLCTLLWFRWLGAHVPLAETRRATLKPRVIDDYVGLPWRIAIDGLTVLHLSCWIVIGALGLAGGAKYWGSFAFFVGLSAFFAIFAFLGLRRPPGYLDRLFGEAYRRNEIKLAYFMRVWPVIVGVIALTELMTGLDLSRLAQLLVASFVGLLALMALRLRPSAPRGGATPGAGLASERRSPA
jgi:hypothetical protein